ncbi:MAG: type I secretion system permease/ATPase [Rhodocyclaceae bacterium]|jgi:ATP-binding cassette subfamily C protein LapB|nr:type I secretion system permease/ATPase [Rhodocyclaceae bacterium]
MSINADPQRKPEGHGPAGTAQGQKVWDQPREQTRVHDPLLECLFLLTRLHGMPHSREALSAGLPLVNHKLTPSLFGRAAKRAGIASKVMRRELGEIESALLPVVLLLKEDGACLLIGWDDDGKSARVVFPELGDAAATVSRAELEARYAGMAIFARPEFRFDRRTPEVGRVARRHWFWGALTENLPVYRDVLLAAGLINVFALAMPLFVMNVYDRVVPNQAVETLWMLAVGLGFVLFFDFMLRMMRGYFIDLAGKRVDVDLSARIMERVLGIRMENRPVSAGSFAANLRSFETVRDFITSATVTALVDLPFAILFIIVMAWIDIPMFLPVIVGMVLVVGYAWLVQAKMHDLAETTYRAGAMRNANLVESLVGLETVKAMGAENVMQRKWERSAIFLARVSNQLRLLAATTTNSAAWVQQLVSLAVIVVGVYRIGEAELTMGGLIACTMLTARAMAPFGQIAGLLTQYHNATTALTSLNEIMGKETERERESSFVSRPVFQGEIDFKDVEFGYPGDNGEALRKVSLHIKPGEHVAMIGRVGSGKSTLLRLMLGLYQPKAGAIRIDGVDIRQLDPVQLRRNIGYVPQDATLFFGSLKENILLATPHLDDAELLAAAQVAGLSDMVNAHPRGFEMTVGERGESLSGGQRQGVAIARAVVHNPPILLLDEPTGSMDHSSEETIKQNLRRFAAGKTMVIVTHRTTLLDLVGRIIVVDGGKIVADGPKDRVIEALRQGRIEKAS